MLELVRSSKIEEPRQGVTILSKFPSLRDSFHTLHGHLIASSPWRIKQISIMLDLCHVLVPIILCRGREGERTKLLFCREFGRGGEKRGWTRKWFRGKARVLSRHQWQRTRARHQERFQEEGYFFQEHHREEQHYEGAFIVTEVKIDQPLLNADKTERSTKITLLSISLHAIYIPGIARNVFAVKQVEKANRLVVFALFWNLFNYS